MEKSITEISGLRAYGAGAAFSYNNLPAPHGAKEWGPQGRDWPDKKDSGERSNRGNGQRGKYWDKRMMADKGDEYLEAVAKIIGGKAK